MTKKTERQLSIFYYNRNHWCNALEDSGNAITAEEIVGSYDIILYNGDWALASTECSTTKGIASFYLGPKRHEVAEEEINAEGEEVDDEDEEIGVGEDESDTGEDDRDRDASTLFLHATFQFDPSQRHAYRGLEEIFLDDFKLFNGKTCTTTLFWPFIFKVEEGNRSDSGKKKAQLMCVQNRIAMRLSESNSPDFVSLEEAEQEAQAHDNEMKAKYPLWLVHHKGLTPEVAQKIDAFAYPPPPNPVFFVEPNDLVVNIQGPPSDLDPSDFFDQEILLRKKKTSSKGIPDA
jgi:hypothetical protein